MDIYNTLVIKPRIDYCLRISRDDLNQNIDFNSKINNEWSDWLYIYTDASKHSDNTCVVVGVYYSEYKIIPIVELPPESVVYSGE